MSDDRIGYSREEAAKKAGVSFSAIKAAINTGALRAKKAGRRYLVSDEQLREWFENLPDA
jgi:excisionase family DNA binding protein